MNLIEFPEQNVVFAKDQPQYLPLPAHRFENSLEGEIVCCWRLSWRERWQLLWRGVIWHRVLTYREPLQPQMLMVDKPPMPSPAVTP
jgi:hypothetical protein